MFVCPECGSSQPAEGRCAADGTPLAPIGEDVLLGTTIGVYRIARLLGVGGMGRVYKGVHPTIGSRVAIKVLSRECSDRRDLVDRFFAEAKAVNLIRHENIVNVLDLAMLPDGRPYIIMEYLDGAPLASIIEYAVQQRAPLPLGGIARLVAEVLDALAAAHAKGIVHRDLKPDNIFVAPSGRPKVLDFGIAKLSDVSNTSTRTGSLLGTPHYMSPEQAAGRAVDLRADIYAIGVILFECATGRKPFLAEALFDLLRMHVEAPPPPPRAMRPDMPPALEQVILTALAKAPAQRFSTAMAMSAALQHATAQLAPEQWRPLMAPGAHLPANPGWAPTPPASWSGRSPQQPSTVSAGQVTRGSRPSSKKGLWIALAVVLVGGGITTGAVLGSRSGGGGGSGSDTPGSDAIADKGPPSTPPSKPGTDPWATSPTTPTAPPTTPTTPTAPPTTPPTTPTDPDDSDDDDADADTPNKGKPGPSHGTKGAEDLSKYLASDAIRDQFKQLDDMIDSLPADQRKQLAAYKGLGKLSPKERMKRVQELSRQGLAPWTGVPRPPTGPGTPAERPPTPTGAWITSHEIDSPPGYDPEHLDVTAFLPWAVAQAKKAIPDAELIRIDTNGVSPDGRANLKLPSHASEHGSIDVRFISPSRGKRDPSQPLGVGRRDFKCMFRIMATPDGVEIAPIDFFDCARERVVPAPRCSFAGVWKKAIAKRAPSQNAVGNVDYRSNGSRPVWYFAIGSGFDVAFSQMFSDDC